MVKKILILVLSSTILSCSNDDSFSRNMESERGSDAESPPEGLKLKSVGGLFVSSFFYNKNGFVDSIAKINSWQGDIETKKYIYNNANQIIALRYFFSNPTQPEYDIMERTEYTYNNRKQITSSITYDKNNVAIDYEKFVYNDDGTLFNRYTKIVNENAVKVGYTTYTFDNFRNPYYNIYPKAYRILKEINKNNILKTESKIGTEVFTNVHSLRYNTQDYIISEQISNMPLDTDDSRGFIYY